MDKIEKTLMARMIGDLEKIIDFYNNLIEFEDIRNEMMLTSDLTDVNNSIERMEEFIKNKKMKEIEREFNNLSSEEKEKYESVRVEMMTDINSDVTPYSISIEKLRKFRKNYIS